MRAVYIAYRFFKEALHGVAGIDREASLATTLFTTGILVGAFAQITAPIFRPFRPRRPKPPSVADCLTGIVAVQYAARSIGGEQLRETPFAEAMIISSLLAPAFTLITLPVRIARAFFAGLARAWRYATRPTALPSQ